MRKADFFSRQVFRSRIFHRTPLESGGLGVAVACGGCEHCDPAYRIDREGFPYWCLEFVVSGRGTVSVGGGPEAVLEPGAIFVYGPRTAYRMESDRARPFVKYFVDFSGKRARALLQKAGLEAGTIAQVFPPGTIAETFDRLIDAGLEETPQASRRASLLLELLLLECADRRTPDDAAESRAFATYRRCRDVIDALDPSGPAIRSIAETARACHLDSAYLSRLFRRFSGTAPYRYMMRRRMAAATARLSLPGSLVKEAAEEFGFSDPYHFSRAFKHVHGVSPTVFLRARLGGTGRAP